MRTETLQITLPSELAEQIRERVRSGQFASESDVVISRLQAEETVWPSQGIKRENDLWVREEIDRIATEMTQEQQYFSIKQVREHLAHRRKLIAKA